MWTDSRRKRTSLNRSHLFVVGWMLLAILFPLYAPWLNGNFAAVQPGHGHLYFGTPDLDHHASPLEELVPHPHQPDTTTEPAVTNLPNLDLIVGTAVLLIAPLLISLAAMLTLFFHFHESQLGITLLATAPPHPPPRISLSQ